MTAPIVTMTSLRLRRRRVGRMGNETILEVVWWAVGRLRLRLNDGRRRMGMGQQILAFILCLVRCLMNVLCLPVVIWTAHRRHMRLVWRLMRGATMLCRPLARNRVPRRCRLAYSGSPCSRI